MKKTTICGFVAATLLTIISTSADAIPAFARKYSTNCNTCHTAYPKLNSTGRAFKENGYFMSTEEDMKGEEKISDYLSWDKYVPLSGLIVLRPYDNESGSNSQIHALHEVEVLSAGRAYKNVSTWFELEAEDDEDSFNAAIRSGFLTYFHNQALSIQAGYGGFLFADPYDTYSDARRYTASHNPIANQRFLGVDNGGRFRDPRQQVSVFGRTLNSQLFYIAGFGGLASDTVGDKSRSYYGRLAFDITQDIMIGGMFMSGSCELGTSPNNGPGCGTTTARDRDFSRVAVDAQADIKDLRIVGVYMNATDDLDAAAGDESNAVWYLEGTYAMRDSGRTTWAPMLRLDSYEQNDGKDSFSTATINIAYYFTQNIKGFFEYNNLYDGPTSADEGSRSTVQLEAAF